MVVGGGPTGVEMAGQIVELSHRALHRNFRTIDPTSARVVLCEGADRILGDFGGSYRDRARATSGGSASRSAWAPGSSTWTRPP